MRGGFGTGGFLAAATAGAAGVGRGAGNGALVADDDAGVRGADDVADVPGSGVMMLTAGVEDAEGNSALVGLPVGIDGGSAATGATGGGAFHNSA